MISRLKKNKLDKKLHKINWDDYAVKLKVRNSFAARIKSIFINIKILLMSLLVFAFVIVLLTLVVNLCPALKQFLCDYANEYWAKLINFFMGFVTEIIGLIALGVAFIIYFEQREVARLNSDKNSSITINKLNYINLNQLGNYNDVFPTIRTSFILKCEADKPNTYKEIKISKLIVFVKDDCDNYFSEKVKIKEKWIHNQNGKAQLYLCASGVSSTLTSHIDNKIRLSQFKQKIALNDDRTKIGLLLKVKSMNYILCFKYSRAAWLFLTLKKDSEKEFKSNCNNIISLNKNRNVIIDKLEKCSTGDFEKEVLTNLREHLIETTANTLYDNLNHYNTDGTNFKIINTMVI